MDNGKSDMHSHEYKLDYKRVAVLIRKLEEKEKATRKKLVLLTLIPLFFAIAIVVYLYKVSESKIIKENSVLTADLGMKESQIALANSFNAYLARMNAGLSKKYETARSKIEDIDESFAAASDKKLSDVIEQLKEVTQKLDEAEDRDNINREQIADLKRVLEQKSQQLEDFLKGEAVTI